MPNIFSPNEVCSQFVKSENEQNSQGSTIKEKKIVCIIPPAKDKINVKKITILKKAIVLEPEVEIKKEYECRDTDASFSNEIVLRCDKKPHHTGSSNNKDVTNPEQQVTIKMEPENLCLDEDDQLLPKRIFVDFNIHTVCDSIGGSHKASDNVNVGLQQNNIGQTDIDSEFADLATSFICKECSLKFESFKELETHMNIGDHINISKNNIHAPSSPSVMLEKTVEHSKYSVIYKNCDEKFHSPIRLHTHERIPSKAPKIISAGHRDSSGCDMQIAKYQHAEAIGSDKKLSLETTKTIEVHDLVCLGRGCGLKFNDRKALLAHLPTCFPPAMVEKVNAAPSGEDSRSAFCEKFYDLRDAENEKLSDDSRSTSEEKSFICQSCNKEFASQFHLQAHWEALVHHKSTYGCRLCNAIYATNEGLLNHVKTKHLDTTTISFACDQRVPKLTSEAHLNEHTPFLKKKPYRCNQCNINFATLIGMKMHVSVKHVRGNGKAKPFRCKHCSMTFKYKFSLQGHVESHGLKSPKCHQCDLDFSGEPELMNQHVIDVHNGLQMECQTCYKRFDRAHNLRYHMSIHSRDRVRRFACDLCDKRFFTPRSLDLHAVRHGEKKFGCEKCGKRFHRNRSLKLHLLLHAGIKNFVCHFCGKRFARDAHLSRHIESHDRSQRKYWCYKCESYLKNLQAFRRHMNSKHKSATESQKCE